MEDAIHSLTGGRNALRQYAQFEEITAARHANAVVQVHEELCMSEGCASVAVMEVRTSMQHEYEAQATLTKRVHIHELGALERQVSDIQASRRQVLAAAEAAARVQHNVMDELRQQAAMAQASERQAKTSASTLDHQFRTTLADRDE